MWPARAASATPRRAKVADLPMPAHASRENEPVAAGGIAGGAAAIGKAALDITDAAMRTAASAIGASAAELRGETHRPAPPRREIIDPDAPSFVGRAANAGLSAFGKFMLLLGLTAAVAYSTLNISTGNGRNKVRMDDGRLWVTVHTGSRGFGHPAACGIRIRGGPETPSGRSHHG